MPDLDTSVSSTGQTTTGALQDNQGVTPKNAEAQGGNLAGGYTTVPNLPGLGVVTNTPNLIPGNAVPPQYQWGTQQVAQINALYVTREELAELKDQFDEIYDILQKLVKITGTEREQLDARIQLFNVKSSHKL